MPYQMKPLACDPARIKNMSEPLIVGHYENNYGGAVKRLNLIEEQLADVDYEKAAGFLVNGLKREQLIAMNSMILHELFFDGLGEQSEPAPQLRDALAGDFGSYERWRAEFIAMGKALGGGSGWVLLSWSPRDRKLVNQWASDHCTHWPAEPRSSRSICTSTPITWTSAPKRRPTWTLSWRSFAGRFGSSLAERGPTARPSPGRSRRCWWCGTISSNLEEMRMRIAHVLALCTLVRVGTAAGAQEIDWNKVAGRRSSRRRPHAGDGRSRTGRTRRWYVACLLALAAVSFAMDRPLAQAPEPLLLQLEGKVPLGDVSGRIDHMAIDLPRRRLFVAELGNDSVAVVDIDERKVQHVITGLKQPQGLGYVPSNDTLFVANAGDGSVRLFRGADYAQSGSIDLGEDADNVRVDAASSRVFVGYGSGGLAEIDPATNGKVLDLPLPAHPEGFQLARSVRRIFVNLPKARMIAVIDRFAGKQVASWPVDNESFVPMALDEQSGESHCIPEPRPARRVLDAGRQQYCDGRCLWRFR